MFEPTNLVAISIWAIEVFLLYLMNLSLLGGSTLFRLLIDDNRIFIGFVISAFLFVIFYILGSAASESYFLLMLLIALGWPIIIYSIEQEERELKSKRMRKNREEIEWLERKLSDIGDDFGPLLRLGKLYEEIGDKKKALEYYRKATSRVKKITLSNTERKIKQLKYFIKSDEEEKQHICKHCGKRNYSTSLFCEKCNKILHSSYWDYLRHYAPLLLKVGIIIFIISAFLFGFCLKFWENLIFYSFIIVDFALFRKWIRV
ncbi:hypothetical protein KAW18_16980 [candidate division WOR-3 bacterium]|nr:hypothetical protein [candidate division WOR-3 bacterium]MCK4529061.1 hypothetical protein [candidate division WOR-3 bacterium]